KDAHDAIQQLATAIDELQLAFFAERSAAIAHLAPALNAATIQPHWCEYYLADANGDVIWLDILGNTYLNVNDLSKTVTIASYSNYLDKNYHPFG
ncbi:MAG: hypothetical protein K5Q00_05835, partial [Gammaproteobacteria bacterium]|nr:hypothetical protein [Gammaproteobacteria bacterium]